jgi:RNA polymerase sigma-70 factor (ECF subfamily)
MHVAENRQERFMKLFEPLQPRLERFALAMTRDRETARDVVGETILEAYQRFDTLRDERAFLGFLFTIAARTYRRRAARSRRHDELTDDHLDALVDSSTPPDTAADIAAVYQALAELPQQQREAVYLFEVQGMSMKEIQEIQGGTLVGVKVRISRGRKKLAAILGIADTGGTREQTQRHSTDRPTTTTIDDQLYSIGIKP